MKDHAIAAAFAEHGPWITRYVIDGETYGGSFDAVNDPRLPLFFASVPTPATILELGALEGGHTIGLARWPGVKRVVAVEGRPENLRRARLAAKLLEVGNVEFIEADLEKTPLRDFGTFDAVFCCGLLYHLPEPWKLTEQFAAVGRHVFLWTHYCQDHEAEVTLNGYEGRVLPEGGLGDPLSGLSPQSFWPTIGALVNMLSSAGLPVLHILSNDPTQSDGPAITIAAFAYRPDEVVPDSRRRRRWWQWS